MSGCPNLSQNQDLLFEGEQLSIPPEQKTPLKCDYCPKDSPEEYPTQEALENHILSKHNSIPIIKVNDEVVTKKWKEGGGSVSEVLTASINFNGYFESVFIDGEKKSVSADYVDITSLVQDCFNKNGKCCIEVGEYKIVLTKSSPKVIAEKKIIDVIMGWSIKIENSEPISKAEGEFNEDESRILDGFYNYFIACRASYNKTDLYDRASTTLSQFLYLDYLIPYVKFVMKVKSFRNNEIDNLRKYLTCNDYFKVAVDFFTNSKNKIELPLVGKNLLFVEKDIQDNLNAISDYMQGKTMSVNSYLEKYTDLEIIKDSNRRDRILLLKAKVYKDKGELAKANKIMNEIKTDCFHL